MDGRRHSVDVPLSRTLVALRRVRSLRDPSTNSMSKFSAMIDNLNWETNSGNAITLGFENGCRGDAPNYNDVSCLDESRLYGETEHVSDHELYYSSRKSYSRLISCEKLRDSVGNKGSMAPRTIHVEGSNAHLLNQGTLCEKKSRSERYCRDYEDKGLELIPSSYCIEGVGSCNGPNEGPMHIDKTGHGKTKRKSRSMKHTRSSRVTAGDVLSRVGSPGLSISDVLMEESSLTSSLYGNEDDAENSDHQGCGISCCWSRTPRFREPNLLPDVEEQPLLSGYPGKTPVIHKTGWKHNNKGVTPYLESPRSLSQKFRPQSFNELVGQNVVARSLLSAISNGRITSLFLFHGPRGTGKTSASRIFAAALNCLSSEIDKPCGLCQECVLFFSGRSRDIKEVDSVRINRKERIKSLIKNAEIPPVSSQFKVYIIDECHLLKGESWATILNNLEELSQHVVFIVITHDLDKLPHNAVSKSQKYQFTKLKEIDIVNRLGKMCVAEGVDFDQDALNLIATKSKGSLRDAEMMLDQLSLVGKKITKSLVYELIGFVSDDELLDLLHLALSSDASNTVKRARELMRSRIDPLQLTSQLANLIMDILAGKCPDGISEDRRKLFFGSHASEADIQQLSHALKILSETEKQLRTSKNQTTWLTAALLQLSNLGSSPDANESRLSVRTTLNPQGADFCSTSTNSVSLKHLVTCACDSIASRKIGMQDGEETLELMWKRATGMCESNSLKKFLRKQGKLMSVRLNQGVAVAGLEFDHRDHVHKAERSWKLIATALQCVLGCNVELRINLARNASGEKGKFKKPSLSLFSCSRRMRLRSQFSSECGNDASENSDFIPKTVRTRDKHVETCSLECGSQISEACCHGKEKEVVKTLRNPDGNALSIGVSTPHRSFTDDMGKTNQLGFDRFKERSNKECLDLIALERESQPGCVSSIQNPNTSNASWMIHSTNQQQCNLALCKTSSETYLCSSNLPASCVRSTNYSNFYRDNTPRESSKFRCWRTATFPFRKAWQLTRQSRGEHMVDSALPCAAAAK